MLMVWVFGPGHESFAILKPKRANRAKVSDVGLDSAWFPLLNAATAENSELSATILGSADESTGCDRNDQVEKLRWRMTLSWD